MLIKYLSKLRSKSKRGLNYHSTNDNYNSHLRTNHVGRKIIGITPILSIFALLGNCWMMSEPANAAFLCNGDGLPSGEDYIWIDNECQAIPAQPKPETYTATINSASLIIDNDVIHDQIKAIYGTNYVSHIVSVKADDIEGYTLTLSGDTQLTGPSNTKNNWSYAWDITSKADNAMAYKAMGNDINLQGDAVNNDGKVDFSRKLAFSTTFADNAAAGTYSGQATLSLVITPKTITKPIPWEKMFYMQDMSPEACASVEIGTAKTLYDYRSAVLYGVDKADGGFTSGYYTPSRIGDKYTIQKLSDGNCWMTQNMKLDLSAISLTPELSDVSATFAAKTEYKADSTWASDRTLVQFTTNGKSNDSYNSVYGYYYSWCATTAGTCSSATTDHAEASSSICPKGWKLPKGDRAEIAKNDFAKLMNLEGASIADPMTSNVYVSWSSKVITGPPVTFTLGGTDWYVAGYVDFRGLIGAEVGAYYWSRTAAGSSDVYVLAYLDTYKYLYPAYTSNKSSGRSVRCIAYSS